MTTTSESSHPTFKARRLHITHRSVWYINGCVVQKVMLTMFNFPFLLAAMGSKMSESTVCLHEIIQTYFEEKSLILVTTPEFLPPSNAFRGLQEKPIILYRDERPVLSGIVRHDEYDLIIFNLKNTRDLSILFRNFRGMHRGKIIVTIEETSRYLARHIISILWYLTRKTDVIVLIMGEESSAVYSWFPYTERECSEVKDIVLIDTWSNGSFLGGNNLFPEKITKDLKGCPLFVSTRSIEPYVFTPAIPGQYLKGYEVMLIYDLIREYNMSLKVVPPSNPSTFWITEINGKQRGVFNLLLERELDIAFGGMMAREDRYQLTDATYPYMMEHLLWIYPKPLFKTHFSSIYVVFAPELWYVIITFHVFAAFAFFLTDKFPHTVDEVHYIGFVPCFFNAIAMLCNTTFPPPRNNFLRFMIISYVIYAIHLSAAYQSFLIALLTQNEREEPFHDISQLADSELVPYVFASGNHLYNTTDHGAWEKILHPGRLKYMDEMGIPPIINDIAVNRSSFLLFPRSSINFLTAVMYPDGGKSLFEYLHYLTYSLTMYVSPGNPLEVPFSNHIQALSQTGVFQYWKKVTMASVGKDDRHMYKASGETNHIPEALGVKHLGGAFLMLLLSLSFSTIVFLAEILFCKISSKMRFINSVSGDTSFKVYFRKTGP